MKKMSWIPEVKSSQRKRTNEERLKALHTYELAKELALIAEWDRGQVKVAKNGPGLVEFMKRWLEADSEA